MRIISYLCNIKKQTHNRDTQNQDRQKQDLQDKQEQQILKTVAHGKTEDTISG